MMKLILWNGDIKKIFKRLLPIALTTIIVFSFAGCGSKEQGGQSNVEPDPPYTEPADPDITEPGDDTDDPVVTPGTDVKDPEDGKDDPAVTPDPGDDTDKDKDDQDKDDFSLAANQKAILENVMPLINYYKRKMLGNSATVDEVYDIFLTKSENSQIVDTIGAIFSGTTSAQGTYLEYGTIKLPTTQNLDYQDLSKNQQTNTNNLKLQSLYHFGVSPSSKKYASTIETIQRKILANYDSALWLGWYGTNYPQYDSHQVVCFDGKTIQLIIISINNDGRTLAFPEGALNKYFVNDEYKVTTNKIEATLPTDTLKAEAQKELFEQAQQS